MHQESIHPECIRNPSTLNASGINPPGVYHEPTMRIKNQVGVHEASTGCMRSASGHLSLDGHEVAEQRAHRRRELGLVEQVTGLSDGLGSGGVRVDHARQATEADLALHRHGQLAAK